MFMSVEDCRQYEHDACAMLRTCQQSVAHHDFASRSFVEPFAGGAACYIAPNSPANKIIGIGFEGVPSPEEFDRIESLHTERDAPVVFEFPTLADPAFATTLGDRGYRCVGFENVLGRPLHSVGAADSLPEAVRIVRSPDSDLEHWLDIAVKGFLAPDTEGVASHETYEEGSLRRDMGAFAAIPGMSRLLVTRQGQDAAAASLWIHNNLASFCGASVLPAHRRNGIQTALIAERLRFAKAQGCTLASVTTSPGSKSQQNMQRHGFTLLYTRVIFTKEQPRAAASGPPAR